ncbi:hypothetical protein BT63DRAFT_450846 [Microthyrium microscopicum]|uniref:Uncharacterized protein n=1 Tax=Microthyrium microscopicum TaxID=703497 RepID=A0A6A6UMY0_9PEZI|nr:hypothetical protein BT63DRAFT_450846 [Microthyrium microscopicum]
MTNFYQAGGKSTARASSKIIRCILWDMTSRSNSTKDPEMKKKWLGPMSQISNAAVMASFGTYFERVRSVSLQLTAHTEIFPHLVGASAHATIIHPVAGCGVFPILDISTVTHFSSLIYTQYIRIVLQYLRSPFSFSSCPPEIEPVADTGPKGVTPVSASRTRKRKK